MIEDIQFLSSMWGEFIMRDLLQLANMWPWGAVAGIILLIGAGIGIVCEKMGKI